jgi:hypothetical protein
LDVPGPGSYSLRASRDKGFIFGTSERPKLFGSTNPLGNGNPGPGSYKIPNLIGEVPKYLIAGRKE